MTNEVTQEQINDQEKVVSELRSQLSFAEKTLSEMKDKAAQQICPHNVGDIIEIKGYSHTGKMMVVDKITRTSWAAYKWRVVGRVIKKDGTPSLNVVDFDGK